MRMMSWSRYHCLSWSFTRIRARLRHERLLRAGHKITTTALSAPGPKGAGPGRAGVGTDLRPLKTLEQGVRCQTSPIRNQDISNQNGAMRHRCLTLPHDPEKWIPVFRKIMLNQKSPRLASRRMPP
jgi:hypothetical protein